MADYDVVVIGAGPGGYVAAIRAAQLGLKTAVVERDALGGICLNWGCIPSKVLLRNAEVLALFKQAQEFGISYENLRYDFGAAIDRSRQVVARLTRGVAALLRKNKVDHIRGEAALAGHRQVTIKGEGRTLEAANIIIATGARPRDLPNLTIDGQKVISSRHALEAREVPASVVIVGGGATGVEFAHLYNVYGSRVTVVEMLPRLLPNEDEETSTELERAFKRQGIEVLTGSTVESVEGRRGALQVGVRTGEGTRQLSSDTILVAVGVTPNSDGLGLEAVGVKTQRGFIEVDDWLSTGVPGIYAIGDVTGKLLLAHVASQQGVMAAEAIAGLKPRPIDYTFMPRAVYCQPQVASFGFTERQAQERGYQVKVGRFPFQASGKALALGEAQGRVKIVADAATGELLGVHLVGHEVTELLGELSLARMLEATSLEVGELVHSHPTMSEAVKEAALAVEGRAIHI